MIAVKKMPRAGGRAPDRGAHWDSGGGPCDRRRWPLRRAAVVARPAGRGRARSEWWAAVAAEPTGWRRWDAACRRRSVSVQIVLSSFRDWGEKRGARRAQLYMLGSSVLVHATNRDRRSRLVAWTRTDDLGWGPLLSRHVPRVIGPGSCQPGPMTRFNVLTGKDFLFSILTFCFHFKEKTFCFPF
jgi:hypothetical protein